MNDEKHRSRSEGDVFTGTHATSTVPCGLENDAEQENNGTGLHEITDVLVDLWNAAEDLYTSLPDVPHPRAYVELCLVVAEQHDLRGHAQHDPVTKRLSNDAQDELNGKGGVTEVATDDSILTIVDEKSSCIENGKRTWNRRVRRYPGPVTERAYNLCSDHLSGHPSEWASATASLIVDGDLSPTEALAQQPAQPDTGPDQDTTTGTTDRTGAGTAAIEPNIELESAVEQTGIKSLSFVAEGRFNGVGPVPVRPYTSARSAGFYATKQRVDLLPEAEIEALLDRTADGSVFPWADIPAELYTRIVEWASAVADSQPLAAILQQNLLAHGRDEDWYREGDNVGIAIPHEKIFAAFGMTPQVGWNRGINSGMLLEIYRRHVDPAFRWTDWNGDEGKARVIKSHSIPDDIIQDAKELMLSPEDYDDWTYLVSGKSANNRRWTRKLRNERRDIIEANEPVIEPPASTLKIQDYLNSLPQQLFGHGAHGNLRPEKIDDAIWTVADTVADEEKRDQLLRSLYWIRKFPQPLYLPCDRFPRLKADHHNQAMNLPSEVLRATYTERDYELDLSKAHLACYIPTVRRFGIDVPVLEEKLRANEADEIDLWAEVGRRFDTELMPDGKARRKAAKRLYSAPYGSTKETMLFEMLKEYGRVAGDYPDSFDAVRPVLSHPLVDELFSTRDKLEAVITDRDGLEDVHGRHIPLSAWDETKDKGDRWRGCMAYVNATYEQELMASVFDDAQDERDRDGKTRFRVWLYQADGVTVRIHRDYAHSPRIERLQNAVAGKADELGVPTELEVDYTTEG